MTYCGFLLRFLVVPLVLLALLLFLRGRFVTGRQVGRSSPLPGRWLGPGAVLLHVVVAVLYTTPWDNYLVANSVWWYDPALVTGITLGWVPIEEYTFFVLQSLLAGTWLLFLASGSAPFALSTPANPAGARFVVRALARLPAIRVATTAATAVIWLASAAILAAGWQPGTYLALELVWALPPIALQLAFGADIVWHHRRLVALVIIPLTLYLALADALAIDFGVWTIDPAQSTGILLGGILPVEELLFFFLTNTLVALGITLLLSPASRHRLRTLPFVVGASAPDRRTNARTMHDTREEA